MIRQGTNILKESAKDRLDYNPDLKQINFLDRRVYKRGEGVFSGRTGGGICGRKGWEERMEGNRGKKGPHAYTTNSQPTHIYMYTHTHIYVCIDINVMIR